MKQYSKTSIIQKGGKFMLYLLSVFAVFILLLTGIMIALSPGKARPFLNESGQNIPGSISEKIFLNINGIRQGMFIKGKEVRNPVLLYLHGGMPDYFLTGKYPTGLEDYFTVVWWEQRGSGLSYSDGIPKEAMTLEQMMSDTKELTNYLRKRFGQEKIYLMGHSGGSFIGIQVAARWPELYHAYIGVAQMTNQLKSESLAYGYMIKQFRDMGNKEWERKLEAAPVTLTDGMPDDYRRLRDPAMHRLGIGTTHDMKSVITGIFLPSLICREYTLVEKINLWRGKSRSGISILWSDMMKTDLGNQVPELKIPVYFFEGIYDYTVSYSLAKDYYEKLKAPLKGFYTFEQSAHSPLFEEPLKMRQFLKDDVLEGKNSHADRTPE
jgi:pimeloyl-ACP methyl ester carboxylesterase